MVGINRKNSINNEIVLASPHPNPGYALVSEIDLFARVEVYRLALKTAKAILLEDFLFLPQRRFRDLENIN